MNNLKNNIDLSKDSIAELHRFLRRPYEINKEVERLESRYLEKNELFTNLKKNIAPSLREKSPTFKTAERKLNRTREKLIKAQTELNLAKFEIAELLESLTKLENDGIIEMMKYRYIDCLDWKEIAGKMFFTVRTLFFRHEKALKILHKSFLENKNNEEL